MSSDKVVGELIRRGLHITTAESCTGGLLAGRIVDTPGSSAILDEAHVTYSNEAKHRLLGVSEEVLRTEGAVSAACAAQMAEGARVLADADIAVSTTGIAGPDGGTDDKPVGLVYIGLATRSGTDTKKCMFDGDRRQVREQTVETAMQMMAEELDRL